MDGMINKYVHFLMFSDSGSGVKEVSVAIGTTPDDSDLLPWTVITTSDGWSSVSANIPDGVDGWIKIQAIDNGKINNVNGCNSQILFSEFESCCYSRHAHQC